MRMRVAIAGAGLMGRWHAKSASRAGGEVVAICDPLVDRAAQLAKKFPGAHVFSDLGPMLEAAPVDVLHLCTPAEGHFRMAAAALTRGISVLVEKPMTLRAQDTEELYALAREKQVLICPVHQFLFQRGVQQARDGLSSIGTPTHFACIICSAGSEGGDERRADEVIGEILQHPLSLWEHFRPGSTEQGAWSVFRPRGGEVLAIQEEAGFLGSIQVSMNARPAVAFLRLAGTKGTFQIDLFHGFAIREPGVVSRPQKILHPFDWAARTFAAAAENLVRRAWGGELAYPGLDALVASFYQAIRHAGDSPISSEAACRVGRAREEILRAMERAAGPARP